MQLLLSTKCGWIQTLSSGTFIKVEPILRLFKGLICLLDLLVNHFLHFFLSDKLIFIYGLFLSVYRILDFDAHAFHARAHLLNLIHKVLHLLSVSQERLMGVIVAKAQKVGNNW